MTLTKDLNDLAGTNGLQAQGAANALAGTNGKALVGALNAAAGTDGLELQGVLGRLGGVPGVAPDGALSEMAFIKRTAPALWLDARFPNGFGGSIPADGTALSQWNDLSGNGRHATQGTPANRPLFRSANPNLLTYNQATVETDTTGFVSLDGTPSLARSTAQASHGAASLAITSASGALSLAGTSAHGSLVGAVPATAGATYSASVALRAAVTTRIGGLYIVWKNSSGALISLSSASASVSSAGWTTLTVTGATAPANTAYAAIAVGFTAGAASEVFYADQLGFYAGSSATWVPPVTLPAGMPVVQFDGGDAPVGHTMRSTASAQGLPGTFYVVMARQVTSAGPVVDGSGGGTPRSRMMVNVSRQTVADSGLSVTSAAASTLGAFGVHSVVLNGASSLAAVNGQATTGDAGSNPLVAAGIDINGYGTSGAQRGCNIYGAVLVFYAAHDTATRQRIERALGRIYGVAVA